MKVFVLCLVVAGILMGFSSALAAGAEEELAPGLSVRLDTSQARRIPAELPYFFSQFKDLLRQWWISEGQATLGGNCQVEVSYKPRGPWILDFAMVGATFVTEKADVFFMIATKIDDSRDGFRRAAHILIDGTKNALMRWARERESKLRRQELQKELREKLFRE